MVKLKFDSVKSLDRAGNDCRYFGIIFTQAYHWLPKVRFQRLEISPKKRILIMMRSGSKAILKRPILGQAEMFGQVLRFEPRRPQALANDAPVSDARDDVDEFASFEQEQDEPINYRQRRIMNLIALAIVTLLVILGVWIADTLTDLQRQQDCFMQGRSNCAPIELPIPAQH